MLSGDGDMDMNMIPQPPTSTTITTTGITVLIMCGMGRCETPFHGFKNWSLSLQLSMTNILVLAC